MVNIDNVQKAETDALNQDRLSVLRKCREIIKFIGIVLLLLVFNVFMFVSIAAVLFFSVNFVIASEHPHAFLIAWFLSFSVICLFVILWAIIIFD